MPTDQAIGTITSNRPRESNTVEQILLQEYQVSFPSANKAMFVWQSNFDPDAIAQKMTATITAGSTGNIYALEISSNGMTYQADRVQRDGDNATAIAAHLARQLDDHPEVYASASGAVITVQSVTPGQAFTLTDDGSTLPGNIVILETVANAGTAKKGKIAEVGLTFALSARTIGASSIDFPEVTVAVSWFNGGNPATTVAPPISNKYTGANSLDSIQTAQGIARPT